MVVPGKLYVQSCPLKNKTLTYNISPVCYVLFHSPPQQLEWLLVPVVVNAVMDNVPINLMLTPQRPPTQRTSTFNCCWWWLLHLMLKSIKIRQRFSHRYFCCRVYKATPTTAIYTHPPQHNILQHTIDYPSSAIPPNSICLSPPIAYNLVI